MSTVTAGSPTETGRRERSQHPLVVQDRPHHRDRDSETLCSVSWTQAAWINWCLSHPKPPRWCWSTEKNQTLFCCLLLSIFCLQYFHISSLPLWTSCRGQQRCDPSLASHSDTLIIESVYVSFIWNVCLMLSRLVTYNTVSVSLQTVELQIKKPTNLPKTSTLSEMLLLGRY